MLLYPIQPNLVDIRLRFHRMSETQRAATIRIRYEKEQLDFNAALSDSGKENDARRKEYINKKEERDALAFASLDKNCDGTIAISDVLDALVPSEEALSSEFMAALGF